MDNSVFVYNLLTEEENYYMEGTSPVQAVKASYALSNNLGTQLAVQGVDSLNLEVLHGKYTVSCGDWVAIK